MSKKKIGIVLDTNIVRDGSGKHCLLDQVGLFLDYSKDLSLAKGGNVKVILPNIIIEEFLQQKKAKLEEKYNSLLDEYNFLSKYVLGAKPESKIDQELSAERDVVAKNVTVLSIEPSKDLFEKMIDDAIKKTHLSTKAMEVKRPMLVLRMPLYGTRY